MNELILANRAADQRQYGMISVWQDFRYSLRGLRNRPSFTLLAVLALAFGIGAATTIFRVIQNVLLDPFPYTDAERVVSIMIHDVASSRPGGRTFFQTPEFLDYVKQNHVAKAAEGLVNGGPRQARLSTSSTTRAVLSRSPL
jgi:hypothetical protein